MRHATDHKDFYDAIETRTGWTHNASNAERNGPSGDIRVKAQRTFEYPRHSAMVWIEAIDRVETVHQIQAHVSVPFSAGPEESFAPATRGAAPLKQVMDWVAHKERILTVPLRIAEARTYDAAHQVLSQVKSARDLWTLSYVFDLDEHLTSAVERHLIICKSAPHLTRKGGANV
jgi:hypothetical protein